MLKSDSTLTAIYDENQIAELSKILSAYHERLLSAAAAPDNSRGVMLGGFPEIDAIHPNLDPVTREKVGAIEELLDFLKRDRQLFNEKLGESELMLAGVRDWNPATLSGLKSTSGAVLVAELKAKLPELENEPEYLMGKLTGALRHYLVVKDQLFPTGDVNSEAKMTEDETVFFKHSQAFMKTFKAASIEDKYQLFKDEKEQLKQELSAIHSKNQGLFTLLSSAFFSSPEVVLMGQLDKLREQMDCSGLKYRMGK